MITPLQRRALVERPFGVVRYIYPVKRWAGVQVQDMESFFHCFRKDGGGAIGKTKQSYLGREEDTRILERELFDGD